MGEQLVFFCEIQCMLIMTKMLTTTMMIILLMTVMTMIMMTTKQMAGDDDDNRTLVAAGFDDICGVITECSKAGCRANDIAALCELELLRLNSADTNDIIPVNFFG